MNKKIFILSFFVLFISVPSVFSQVLLPSFISENMVLQQQTEAPILGKAKPNRKKMKASPVNPVLEQLQLVNPSAMRRALADLEKMFPDRYPASDQLSVRIDELEKSIIKYYEML